MNAEIIVHQNRERMLKSLLKITSNPNVKERFKITMKATDDIIKIFK